MLIKLIPGSHLWNRLRSKVEAWTCIEAKTVLKYCFTFYYIIGLIWNLIHGFCSVNFERIMGKTLFHKATAQAHITCFCICFIRPTKVYFIRVTLYKKTPIIWINYWLCTLIFLSSKLGMWRSFWVLICFANLF